MSTISALGAVARILLGSKSDLYFHLSLYCLAPVLLGLFIELIELIKIKRRFDATRGILAVTPMTVWLEEWGHRLKVIGWVLVFIGVVGEAVFEFAGLRVDSLISDVNTIVLADVQAGASRAVIEAGAANAQAGNAIERAALLDSGLETERQETARLRKAADDSKRELLKDISHVEESTGDRFVVSKCVSDLAGKPKGTVSRLLYSPGDAEAWKLAEELYACLGEGTNEKPGAGWSVTEPVPIPEDLVLDRRMINAPPAFRAGGSWGVSIISREGIMVPESAAFALGSMRGFEVNPPAGGIDLILPSMPENTFFVIVGPKPPYTSNDFIRELNKLIVAKAKKAIPEQ
jgi:hypothetical protein